MKGSFRKESREEINNDFVIISTLASINYADGVREINFIEVGELADHVTS